MLKGYLLTGHKKKTSDVPLFTQIQIDICFSMIQLVFWKEFTDVSISYMPAH